MSEFRDLISVECKASIECAGCGATDDASCDNEGSAIRQLEASLEREHWGVLQNGQPYCRQCMEAAARERVRIEAEQQAAAIGYVI